MHRRPNSVNSDISAQEKIQQAIVLSNKIILGKEKQIQLAIACLLARGHLLIEDLPGMGKTTLAHVLAKVLGLNYDRVQFTSDMLPSDILGSSIFNSKTGEFKFLPGPIFSQLVLADEVNRTTPKTQSALLEAMEENQITIEGKTHSLPSPFFVIATQNPSYQIGTFPLPESQLDRFLMRLELGYPDAESERALLKGEDRRDMLRHIQAAISPEELLACQLEVPKIHTSDALIDYLQTILELSRESTYYQVGLSPRGGLALLRGSQAWALLQGRDHVIPEDVQLVLPYVVGHRLQASVEYQDQSPTELARHLCSVAIP